MSSSLTFQHGCVIFDACCVINLYATDRMDAILQAAPVKSVVCSYVKEKEVLGVFDGIDSDGNDIRTPIDLQPLIETGILSIITPDWSIVASHIVLLAQGGMRGMGEKISGAIARDKNWAIATDDRDARRKFARLMPAHQVVTTLDFVHYWAETESVADDVISEVLMKIQVRGKAELAKNHPLYNWASKYLLRSHMKIPDG